MGKNKNKNRRAKKNKVNRQSSSLNEKNVENKTDDGDGNFDDLLAEFKVADTKIEDEDEKDPVKDPTLGVVNENEDKIETQNTENTDSAETVENSKLEVAAPDNWEEQDTLLESTSEGLDEINPHPHVERTEDKLDLTAIENTDAANEKQVVENGEENIDSKAAAVDPDTSHDAENGEKKDPEDVDEKKEEPVLVPPSLTANLSLFTPKQQKLALDLCEAGQGHLFSRWPKPAPSRSASSEATTFIKRRLIEQLERIDDSYPSNLIGYINNAKDLLAKSKSGVNPLMGWKPSVPQGMNFEIGTTDYETTEKIGVQQLGKCGFVLTAGGLGERLGYGSIKLKLPTELATETCYLQFYIETILSIQKKYAAPGHKLPLCIMVSGDTNKKTISLLAKNKNFGMDDDQITIVQQGEGVPALVDNDAHFALDTVDRYKLQLKPHGHGDIHALIHSNGVAKKWLKDGIKWTVFFQDTNGLAFHTIALALGVSSKMGLIMNSVCCPRRAKQAIGGIAKLTNEDGEERTINVEYNQLDPLLRSSGFPEGDVNDESTGYSPYPGNLNQLVFSLEPYALALERTNGAMPEFVNPKYKDAEKTEFKKPTRLECMMQDFPVILTGIEATKVGFTSISADMCFSPVKNATADGVAMQKKGTAPGVAASGEADQYAAVRKIMRSIGCKIDEAGPATYSGISVVPGPAIVLKPNFVSCSAEYKEKFPTPSNINISARSSLVVIGEGVTIKSLTLDGALIIECEDGATGEISNMEVTNGGWENVADENLEVEFLKMRGYSLNKVETNKIVFKKDGSIESDIPTLESTVNDVPDEKTIEKEIATVPMVENDSSVPQSDNNDTSASKNEIKDNLSKSIGNTTSTKKKSIENSAPKTKVPRSFSEPEPDDVGAGKKDDKCACAIM